MKLTSYQYTEFHGRPNEWKISGMSLGEINLVVGKNTSGKSRTLVSIVTIAMLVSNRLRPLINSGEWDCTFSEGADEYHYHLKGYQNVILKESLTKNGVSLLDRREDATGTIWNVNDATEIELGTPPEELAIVNRRVKQHDFCDKLYAWGKSVYSYTFGTDMGKGCLAVQVNMPVEIDDYNQNAVIGIFRKGQLEIGETFIDAVKGDMERLGYPLSAISVGQPSTVPLFHPQLVGINVTEKELGFPTEQPVMSSGMFRAFSVVIQFNYALMSSKARCVLVDDVGEGLDFERSCELIGLLKEKSIAWNVQLILSTNDRFVMNKVPLNCWTVLKRQGGEVKAFNYRNSQKVFDEFRFTGLNNFDFFAMDFVTEEMDENQEEGTAHEEVGSVH